MKFLMKRYIIYRYICQIILPPDIKTNTMAKKTIKYIILLILLILYFKGVYEDEGKDKVTLAQQVETVDYPIISYSGYDVMYNPEYKIPKWVRYELLASETDGANTREGLGFRQDNSLNAAQADNDDYRNSGWSRGHMAPAGDFKWSNKAMEETFYFTNCCPQNQSLNAGQWSTLEKKVRNWANKYGKVTVVTGPLVWENKYGTIGENKVLVPDAFFKAVLSGRQSIAFVMFNKAENENIQKCAISVDHLEVISGIDFFQELDDETESQVESTYNLKHWDL